MSGLPPGLCMSVEEMLARFSAISLESAERVKLQDRKDTKYILPASLLPTLLGMVKQDYQVLEIEGVRIQTYESTYYDTPQHHAYLEHHNGHLNRTKIRIRDYVESEVSFFELKTKDNHLRTVKSRAQVPFRSEGLPADEHALLSSHWKHGVQLQPTLEVGFRRIMLAHTGRGERVTIDLDLYFQSPGKTETLPLNGLCVVEVKQGRKSSPSPMQLALHAHHILKSPMSKYCVGMTLLNADLKRNRFKPLLSKIDHILEKEKHPNGIQQNELIHPQEKA